ncbi:MAG: MmcQ/YjbR family DNA-binding protein [Thermotogae bacterium]|nr:MmcQ/YjbR family DNA-binding protein [Thermotogota bacterium]MCP5465446.1 MmcQ/YjbR family DNA-binding protein [Thermotogota bacterium]
MNYEWLDDYCLSKKGAVKDYKEEWSAWRYMIGGKMFLMCGGDKYGKPIFTLKCEPVFGQIMRDEYKDIIPGYYMNKQHWNSVYEDGNVPDELLMEMIDMSYELVFKSLTKKVQEEINNLK